MVRFALSDVFSISIVFLVRITSASDVFVAHVMYYTLFVGLPVDKVAEPGILLTAFSFFLTLIGSCMLVAEKYCSIVCKLSTIGVPTRSQHGPARIQHAQCTMCKHETRLYGLYTGIYFSDH